MHGDNKVAAKSVNPARSEASCKLVSLVAFASGM